VPEDHGLRTVLRLEPTERRLRAMAAAEWVFDTTEAAILFQTGVHPRYVLPVLLLRARLVTPRVDTTTTVWSLATRDGPRPDAVTTWNRPPAGLTELSGYLHVRWSAMDAWFEEDQEVFYGVRDPYRRVDILPSSRSVQITIDGGPPVAATTRAALLLETGLPAQWYVPRTDVDWTRMRPSRHRTRCQYKGIARYWHVRTHTGHLIPDLAWSYEDPVPEAPKLAQLVGFPRNHTAVATLVDGRPQATHQPGPHWMGPGLRG
jgi:uncharacterized protein (DUF427 family)